MVTEHWRSFLPTEEAETYGLAGFGGPQPFGVHPALLVIDCTLAFTGSRAFATVKEAVKEYPTACGPSAWEALPHVVTLIGKFREKGLPIVFSRSDLAVRRILGGATKSGRSWDPDGVARGNKFPSVIQPADEDVILEKGRASVFFGTPLASYLRAGGVDTVVACGTTTSGCVRASVVDAFSHGFVTFVAEEACFDRSPTAAQANLWDMNAKYASVVPVKHILKELAALL